MNGDSLADAYLKVVGSHICLPVLEEEDESIWIGTPGDELSKNISKINIELQEPFRDFSVEIHRFA
jgi:hypothetical protein